MKLSQLKQNLNTVSELNFVLPNGTFIPPHFHITEAGLTTKHFIDCGGTVRSKQNISFQVWVANDLDHRLQPQKLLKIIGISENLFEGKDNDIEVEYQMDSISRFGLEFDGQNFILTKKETNCLAQDHCGIPPEKIKIRLSDLQPANEAACCSPGSGCC